LNSDRETEPFDEALDRETWSLYNQRLQWDLELATKRRKRPQEVVDVLEKLFQVQDAALEELDPPIEADEDRPDDTVPNGQTIVQFASRSLTLGYRSCTCGDEQHVLEGGCFIGGPTAGTPFFVYHSRRVLTLPHLS